MKTERTRAIVLRRTNYGEADRIIQVITPIGKKSVIAKGVRREKSRLAGGIELFAVCDVVIGGGRGDLDVLVSSRLVKFYGHILEDFDRMQFGYLAIKLISSASEMVNEPEWYDILAETFAGLDSKTVLQALVQTWFYLRYSSLMGYELSLYHDTKGAKLASDLRYTYEVSDRGLKPFENGELTSDHIKLLRLIATKPIKNLAAIGGIETVIDDCLLVARQHAAI